MFCSSYRPKEVISFMIETLQSTISTNNCKRRWNVSQCPQHNCIGSICYLRKKKNDRKSQQQCAGTLEVTHILIFIWILKCLHHHLWEATWSLKRQSGAFHWGQSLRHTWAYARMSADPGYSPAPGLTRRSATTNCCKTQGSLRPPGFRGQTTHRIKTYAIKKPQTL